LLVRFRERVQSFPAVRRLVRALVLVGRGFRGEAITLRACALTYLTLFALVPLLAVLYSVLDLVSGEAQFHDRVQTYVNSQLGIGAGAAISAALTTFTSKARSRPWAPSASRCCSSPPSRSSGTSKARSTTSTR